MYACALNFSNGLGIGNSGSVSGSAGSGVLFKRQTAARRARQFSSASRFPDLRPDPADPDPDSRYRTRNPDPDPDAVYLFLFGCRPRWVDILPAALNSCHESPPVNR